MKKVHAKIGLSSILAAFVLMPPLAGAGTPTTGTHADNSSVNKHHSQSHKKLATADNQSNAKGDVEMIRRIRREIVADKDLSTYGHNVKILAHSGKVVLKGPVRSLEEKKTIEGLAVKEAGEGHVKSELTVAR